MLTGVIIGGVIADAVGALVCFAAPFIGLGALGLHLGLITAAFAATGAAMGATSFGSVGAVSHVRATSLAEKHARDWVRMPGFEKGQGKFYDMPFYEGLYGHHYEVPPDRDEGKLFHWKTALIGMGIAAGATALFAIGGIPLGLFAAIGIHSVTTGMVSLFAASGALFGASYGIDRSRFRSLFNTTDAWTAGESKLKIASYPTQIDPKLPPKEQALQREQQKELFDTQMRRQDLISNLENKYHRLIFWNAVGGRFKGFLSGPVLGLAVGAAVGVGVLAVASLLAPAIIGTAALTLGISTIGAAWAMVGTTAGMGALMGMDIFADAGMQAGAESMAKAIDEEHYHNLKLIGEGKQPEFKLLKEDKSLFNFKAAALCTLVGAAVGIPLAFTPFGAALMELLPGAAAGLGAKIAASSLVSALVGTSYGIKFRSLKMVGDFTQQPLCG